jgi:TldD protein
VHQPVPVGHNPHKMKALAAACLDAAALAGATYADVRITDTTTQGLTVRDGVVEGISSSDSIGFGIRVVADGAWGFASSFELTEGAARRVADQAVAIARASATVGGRPIVLADVAPASGSWVGPCVIDPFKVGIEEKIGLLLAADASMRAVSGISLTRCHMWFLKCHKVFASSEGALLDQRWTESSAGIVAYAIDGGEVLPRSYPNSLGGGCYQGGWETITALDLEGGGARMAEQAVALLRAPECPSATTTLIIDSSQLALQIHESMGHPTELDRVLGDEAALAGTSWVSVTDLGSLRYGSEIVNVTADATVPGSIGSFGWDDEGVPAQRDHLIRDGILAGLMSSRESAATIGSTSNGCMRAESWGRVPLVRMTTVSLEPGNAGTLEDLIADTDEGLYVETNHSWSIDDRRLNFQFACEIGWEVRDGKLGRMVKRPNYTGITPRFWGACDAIGSAEAWTVWGVDNCGKGEPMQTAHVAHGTAPARFREVQVGVGR